MKPTTAPMFLLLCSAFYIPVEGIYYVGVGRADCTGPAAEVTFMGYGQFNQRGCGIHLRQFSRAFILNDTKTQVTFISVDACMINHPVKQAVINKLAGIYPNSEFTLENTVISGTHTHSTPGGLFKDILLDITSLGFQPESFNAVVDGIVRSVERARNNMVEAKILVNSGELLNTNINRSPASYLLNPEQEVKNYKYNVDKDMVQVKFLRKSDKLPIGAINWFAVHPTSMNNTNCLISSDNVGYASILLESSINTGFLPGQGPFVGAFASTNLGDVSPNIKGPICITTGKPCDFVSSTCNGNCKYCIASGPGENMFDSTKMIATNLFRKSKELLEDKKATEISGDIKYIHRFSYMPNQTAIIQHANGTKVKVRGCIPALGYGFPAGTTDGPGMYPFAQAKFNENPYWKIVKYILGAPTSKDISCHFPKPIFLMTGKMKDLPYEWQPDVVATQVLQIGRLYLIAVPGEFTTMSGRRMRDSILKEVVANGGPNDAKIVIAGLSNVYTSYITTPEEYQLQRYEGASTIFGPHTLTIYLKLYKELTAALIRGQAVKDDATPCEFPYKLYSFLPPVIFDNSGLHHFGDCIIQPNATYQIGDTVSASFVTGHPRNNNLQEQTFLTVEKKERVTWAIVATDASWETKFIWKGMIVSPISTAEIQWKLNANTDPGTYRIRHNGYHKAINGKTRPYSGVSNTFMVHT